MSQRVYEQLRVVGLLDGDGQPIDISAIDEGELRAKLNHYYAARAEGAEAEATAERSPDGTFSAFRNSISCLPDVERTTSSALVYHRTYVSDPLIRLAEPERPGAREYVRSLGLPNNSLIDRRGVTDSLTRISQLAPLVRAGLCSILPIDLLHKAPTTLPLYASPDGFASQVPERIRELVADSAEVREVVPGPDNESNLILDHAPDSPNRQIHISFRNDLDQQRTSMVFILSESKRVFRMHMGRARAELRQRFDPEQKPSKESYQIWVKQSINRTVLNRISDISSQLRLARGLNAVYVTESAFEGRLLGEDGTATPHSQRASAVKFLHAVAPFLQGATPATVAAVRQDHPQLFEKYRAALIYISAQLRGDGDDFEDRARGLYVKEVEPLVRDIDKQFSKVAVQAASSGLLAAGGVLSLAVTKIAATPLSLSLAIGFGALAAIQAIGQTIPTYGEYRQKKQDVAFIWTKLAKP